MRQLILLVLPLFFIGVHSKSPKLLPFQIVKFPNDPCNVSGGTKNGTCYTSEECSDKGGTSAGSCAEGYGVCCTFSVGCGGTSAENCTYFEIKSPKAGPCSAKVCPCNQNICQLRLDFETFAITGPATITASGGKKLNGIGTDGLEFNHVTQCLTDTFGVSHTRVPTLCGTLTGEHVYMDASENCNDLDFVFGENAHGVGSVATRSVNIRVLQLECGDMNLPPSGCTQWFSGAAGSGEIQSFGYDGTNPHLANQNQIICIRREQGNCKICYYAADDADVTLSGKGTKGIMKDSSCCAYGADGKKSTGAYDCIMIPGAAKDDSEIIKPSQCGGREGLVTASSMGGKTVCSKVTPFRLEFYSDATEIGKDGVEGDFEDTAKNSKGFKLKYFQSGGTSVRRSHLFSCVVVSHGVSFAVCVHGVGLRGQPAPEQSQGRQGRPELHPVHIHHRSRPDRLDTAGRRRL